MAASTRLVAADGIQCRTGNPRVGDGRPGLGIHVPRDSVCRGEYSATADDGGPALHRRHSVVRVVAIPRHTCADKNSLEERCNRWWAVFSGQSRNVGLGGTESAVGISGPVVRDLAFVDRGALALHG